MCSNLRVMFLIKWEESGDFIVCCSQYHYKSEESETKITVGKDKGLTTHTGRGLIFRPTDGPLIKTDRISTADTSRAHFQKPNKTQFMFCIQNWLLKPRRAKSKPDINQIQKQCHWELLLQYPQKCPEPMEEIQKISVELETIQTCTNDWHQFWHFSVGTETSWP